MPDSFAPAVPGLYELCEKESVYYIIRLKSNTKLKALGEELHLAHEIQDVSVTESYVEESIYQTASWSIPRRIIIQSTRLAGELFFSHAFSVTNLSESFSPEAIIASYKKHGTMVNFIKEAKDGFGLDQMKRINVCILMYIFACLSMYTFARNALFYSCA